MRKKSLQGAMLALLLTLVLTGCSTGSEKDRLKDATVEMACTVAKPSMDLIKEMMENPEDESFAEKAETMETDMMAKMDEIAKKYGFEGADNIQEVGKKYEDDKDFENEIKEAVKKECDFDLDQFGEGL